MVVWICDSTLVYQLEELDQSPCYDDTFHQRPYAVFEVFCSYRLQQWHGQSQWASCCVFYALHRVEKPEKREQWTRTWVLLELQSLISIQDDLGYTQFQWRQLWLILLRKHSTSWRISPRPFDYWGYLFYSPGQHQRPGNMKGHHFQWTWEKGKRLTLPFAQMLLIHIFQFQNCNEEAEPLGSWLLATIVPFPDIRSENTTN